MKRYLIGSIVFFIASLIFYYWPEPAAVKVGDRYIVTHQKFLTISFDIPYSEKFKPVIMENLVLPGKVGPNGVEGNIARFIRALRFKELCDAVEDRYNLPQGIIFGMMVQESNGVEFLPNGKNDGGFGLCHMQPSNAQLFGLNTFGQCKELVCRDHALQLKNFIAAHPGDRKALAEVDDRLHHLKNLDAVGRMLAYHMSGKPAGNRGPLRTAIFRYAGETNYEQYWNEVLKNIRLANDSSFLANIERTFNELNPNLLIDGKKGDWKAYLESFHQLNENYGLSEYLQLPKYEPKNSKVVLETFQNFL